MYVELCTCYQYYEFLRNIFLFFQLCVIMFQKINERDASFQPKPPQHSRKITPCWCCTCYYGTVWGNKFLIFPTLGIYCHSYVKFMEEGISYQPKSLKLLCMKKNVLMLKMCICYYWIVWRFVSLFYRLVN